MPFLIALLVVLATYRITRLLVADAFPPIAHLRAWPSRRFGDDSSWAYLAECPWCASMYVAPLVVLAVDLFATTPVVLPVLLALAASAITGALSEVMP